MKSADPEVMRWSPALLPRSESDAMVDRVDARIAEDGFGFWALEQRATGEFLGFTGITPVWFESWFTPAIEIGWRLARSAWGHGYATEAARAAMEIEPNVVSFTSAGNVRSSAR